MKVDLQKIKGFYESDLGTYALKALGDILKKTVQIRLRKDSFVICASAFYPFVETVRGDQRRVALQTYHDQTIWPEEGSGHYVLSERFSWPYRAEEVDDVILLHDLEFAEDPEKYLNEAYRVLKGEGRLVVIFPNRTGAWARYDNTPFGKGYPYTLEQMKKLLSRSLFSIDSVEGCLFFPPYPPKTKIGLFVRKLVDFFGAFCFLQPGIYVIEASKHIYQPSKGLREIAAEKAKNLFPQAVTNATNKTSQ